MLRARRRFALRAGLATAIVITAAAVPHPVRAAAAAPPIVWSACTEGDLTGFDCGTYEVPLDHDQPAGATTTIALARRPADDPAARIGTIFVSGGGEGAALRFLVPVAAYDLAPEVLARFDVVAFDPRGTGASDPIRCFPTDAEARATQGRIRDVPLTAEEIASTLRANHDYAEVCRRNAGPLLTRMSTLNTAKDLDLLRRAVGEARLTFIGDWYGTLIGATYLNLFPDKVRGMIMDSPVDPAQHMNQPLTARFNEAGGTEIALGAYLAACDAAGPDCAFSGNARAKLDAIHRRFRQGPVTLPGNETITIDVLNNLLEYITYNPRFFPDNAETLQFLYEQISGGPAATRGKLTSTPPQVLARLADDYRLGSSEASYAVKCADADLPRNSALYPGLANAFEAAHPLLGRSAAFRDVRCADWPRTTERYRGPWNKPTSATVLVVDTTNDPRTQYDTAGRMTRALGNARRLTLDGFGSTARNSACVTGWYTRYLLAGELPPAGTRCAQDRRPFPPQG